STCLSAIGSPDSTNIIRKSLGSGQFRQCTLQLDIAVRHRRPGVVLAKCSRSYLITDSPLEPISILIHTSIVCFQILVLPQECFERSKDFIADRIIAHSETMLVIAGTFYLELSQAGNLACNKISCELKYWLDPRPLKLDLARRDLDQHVRLDTPSAVDRAASICMLLIRSLARLFVTPLQIVILEGSVRIF